MSPRAWLSLALFCSLTPLALGVAIFALWLPTHWELLAVGGLLTIAGGTCLFPIGLLATYVYTRKARGEEAWKRKAGLSVALLFLNFSTALSILMIAARVGTRFTVDVVNDSGQHIEAFDVMGRGLAAAFGDLPPGARRSQRFLLSDGDQSLIWRFVQGGATREGEIEGYVDNSRGGDWRVTLLPGGEVHVRNLRLIRAK